MASELYAHGQNLKDKVVELAGFSEMTAEQVLTRTLRFTQREDHVRDVLVIGIDGSGTPFFSISGGLTQAEAIFLLERIKLDMLVGELTHDFQDDDTV